MRRPLRTTLLVRACIAGLAAALAGCASSPRTQPPTPTSTSGSQAPADPDQLLVEALRAWSVQRDPVRAVQLAARATTAAPKRADAAWLHLRLCEAAPRCETEALESRMRKLDPDNGVVWFSVLKRAQAEKDIQAEGQILTAMSRASAYRIYWTALVHRLTTAAHAQATQTGAATGQTLNTAMTDTIGWLSAITLPAAAPLSTSCSQERIRDPARRVVCERIATTLQQGDAYVVEGLGLGIAERLAAPGSSTARQIEQRVETLAYQNRAAGAVIAAQVERDKFSAEMLELMAKLPREQDVSLAILRWAGEPLTP